MPFLTDAEINKIVKRAVKKALRGNPDAENQAAVAELTDSGEDNHERQSGRHTGGGFAAAAREVIKKSDLERQRQEKIERDHRGW